MKIVDEKINIDHTCRLLNEAANHLEGFESGCECEEVGSRCIKCLREDIYTTRAYLLAEKYKDKQ